MRFPFLWVLLLLVACTPARRSPSESVARHLGLPETTDIQVVDLPWEKDGRWLAFAVSADGTVQWFRSQNGGVRELPPPPVALIPERCVPSPDGRYLAVISRGEGHPMLDLLDLHRVLEGAHGEAALRTIDPYPGSIELVGWRHGRLEVRCDRPLTACCDANNQVAGERMLPAAKIYRLVPETGTIEEE